MQTFEAIETLLAVRSYKDTPIPDEIVHKIVQAGRLTASAMNRQTWDFIVIRSKDRIQKLGTLASTGPYIAQAPLAIAVVVPDDKYGPIDGGRATQDMMLTAWEEGVGSNWVGNVDTDEIKDLLNVPRDLMILNVIPFGYPTEDIGEGKKDRKPLGDVAHAEEYGQPFSG